MGVRGRSFARTMKHYLQFGKKVIMNPREAARYLGVTIITLYRLTKKGELPGFKIGGQWRFKKDLLDAWIVKKINKNIKHKGV